MSLLTSKYLICDTVQGQTMLARQFWEQDYQRDALRSLLDSTHRCFPYEFAPLLRILTPLAGDAHCAAIV